MLAIEIASPGGPEALVPAQREIPVPGHQQILIKVKVAGVNRPDALQRGGLYAPPPGASDLPGLEAAGEVVAAGSGARRWKTGDIVTALLPGGGYAEYAVTHEDHALPVPRGMEIESAGAICETFFTVWANVFMRGGLGGGESILVHGGSSGIGTTAIQLAERFGARVLTTAGTDAKCARCRELGADVAINYKTDDFVEAVKSATGGRGVDMILDMVGGDYIARNIKSLADEGRLVQIAFLSGSKAEINFLPVMARRLSITGSTLRPRSDLEKARIAQSLHERVWPLLESGRVAPVMDSVFSLEEAAEAHRRLESSEHIGKIVMRAG